MKFSRLLVGLGIVVLLVLASFMKCQGWRNNLIAAEENTNEAWAQVENQLQRRMDLIPNLVETVKGYAAHEREVLTAVTEARSRVAGAGSVSEKIATNNQLTSALSRLLVVVERYPDLKANQNFLALQDELAGTENRIAVERKRYNEAVRNYNQMRRQFPYYLVIKFMGMDFKEKPYFEAAPGARSAPAVKF